MTDGLPEGPQMCLRRVKSAARPGRDKGSKHSLTEAEWDLLAQGGACGGVSRKPHPHPHPHQEPVGVKQLRERTYRSPVTCTGLFAQDD